MRALRSCLTPNAPSVSIHMTTALDASRHDDDISERVITKKSRATGHWLQKEKLNTHTETDRTELLSECNDVEYVPDGARTDKPVEFSTGNVRRRAW